MPFEDDGISVFGFEAEPELDRVLGATTFVVDILTGEIVESDVFFNSIFTWSTAAAGEPGRFDLQSVAAHEIGHFVGLGHSALGETEMRPEGGRRVLGVGAVMFPISLGRGVTADRTLQPDDIAGVSDLYPDGDFRDRTGAVAGRVARGTAPASSARTSWRSIRRRGALVGGFSLGEGGAFQIAGLAPGAHVIRVEPLDDADIDSFFSSLDVDVDFQVTFTPGSSSRPRAAPAIDSTSRCGRSEHGSRRVAVWRSLLLVADAGDRATRRPPNLHCVVSSSPRASASWAARRSATPTPTCARARPRAPYRLFATSSRLLGTQPSTCAPGSISHAAYRLRGARAVRPSGGAHRPSRATPRALPRSTWSSGSITI